MKSHASTSGRGIADAVTIIMNSKSSLVLNRGQANDDVTGVAVLDCIVHRFAGNVIEMRGDSIVVDQNGTKTLKLATDSE